MTEPSSNLTDTEHRRAVLAHAIDRKRLRDIATIATADTLQRWYRGLVAQPGDRATPRMQPGRSRVAPEIEHLVIRMAEENVSRGYRCIQGRPTLLSANARGVGLRRNAVHLAII